MKIINPYTQEVIKEVKSFPYDEPDPSEFISRPEMMMGNQNSKGYVPTQEEREQRRQTMLGVKHTPERRRNQSEAHRGVKFSKEHVNSMIKARVGRKWFNDGQKNTFTYDCPEGYTPGMVKRK